MLKKERIVPSVWGGINVFNIFKEANIFLLIVHSSCKLILCPVLRLPSPGWIKTRLYPVISSYGYFFYMPRFFDLLSRCRTSFIPVFSQRTILLTHASEQTCALKTFSEIEGQQAYSRRKEYFDPFSVAQVIIVRGFLFFFSCFILINSFVFFLYANFPFHSLWSRERQLPAVTTKQLFAKQTLMCSFLFFLMI